jgi:hypothetical protein
MSPVEIKTKHGVVQLIFSNVEIGPPTVREVDGSERLRIPERVAPRQVKILPAESPRVPPQRCSAEGQSGDVARRAMVFP